MYPSLEDMKVDQTVRAQKQAFDAISQQQQLLNQHAYPNLTVPGVPSAPPMGSSPLSSPVYPELADYMGLELSETVIAANMPEYLQGRGSQQLTSYVPPAMPNNMVAPLSGSSVGLARAGTTNGIRELVLCKDGKGKVGLRVQAINKGVFVCVVVRESPAAMAGLRFGDQILQVNGTTVAGYSVDDVHKILKKSSHNNISVVIRDRPFERIVTLHKDSSNCVGFQFKNGKITSIVKDSSAARNGLLIEHQLLEIDGQNVVSTDYLTWSRTVALCLFPADLIEGQRNHENHRKRWTSRHNHHNANLLVRPHDEEAVIVNVEGQDGPLHSRLLNIKLRQAKSFRNIKFEYLFSNQNFSHSIKGKNSFSFLINLNFQTKLCLPIEQKRASLAKSLMVHENDVHLIGYLKFFRGENRESLSSIY